MLPEAKWYPLSACLWTNETQLPGKAAIAVQYADLQDLFVNCLGVEEPTTDTYVKELEFLISGTSCPAIEKVKTIIKEIGSRKPHPPALEHLKLRQFLPVWGINGALSLKSAMDDFIIVDRKKYGNHFRGVIPSLDFSVEEVRGLESLILALGLSDRYMSQTVQETSSAKESVLEPLLSQEMKLKAYPLFWSVTITILAAHVTNS